MRFSEISYEENVLHPVYGTYLPKRIGAKIIINEGEDEMEAYRKAKAVIDKFAEELAPVDSTTKIRLLVPAEADPLFEQLKMSLGMYEYKEDAMAYLETTDYRFAIEAKNIINLKKSKNEKGNKSN